jgi:hypothetical protein
VPPILLLNVELVREAKLLGVYFSDTFSMERQVNYVLKICAQRSCLLELLRKQGLSIDSSSFPCSLPHHALMMFKVKERIELGPVAYVFSPIVVLMEWHQSTS